MSKGKHTLCLTCMALSMGATAQDVPPAPIGPRVVLGGAFEPRALAVVYGAPYGSCVVNVPPPVLLTQAQSAYVVEDVDLTPGPWGASYSGSRSITHVDWMFQVTGWTGTPTYAPSGTPQFFINHVFEFHDPGSYLNSPMLSTGSPFAVRVIPTNFGSGYAWAFTAPLNPPVNAGTRTSFWVTVRAVDPSTGQRLCTPPLAQPAMTYQSWLGHEGALCAGSTDDRFGSDSDCNGVFNDAPMQVHSGGVPRSFSFALRGELFGTPPPASEIICPLADGLTMRSVAPSPASGQMWVQLCLNGPVSDNTLRYLNVDTETSAQGYSLALYDSSANVIATDNGSGSGPNSQLTFGVGRAAGVGDGAQYDGRDGELQAGTYYLCVAAPGASFQDGFVVTSAPLSGSGGVLRIRTNVNSGGSLPPVAPPVPDHADFFATPFPFGAADALQGVSPPASFDPAGDASDRVLWTRFVVGLPGAAPQEQTYLDIDLGFGTPTFNDTVMYLFNATGDLVAYNDDQLLPLSTLSAMSFGAFSPSRPHASGAARGPSNAPQFSFRGLTGILQPGTYYLALAAWPTKALYAQAGQIVPPGVGRRFHVRGLSASLQPVEARFFTGPGNPLCDSIDFNQDELFPDTLDIDDYLSVFSGGVCGGQSAGDIPCNTDLDFNNDGLFPDTSDIDAFLRAFSGGDCYE